MYMSLFSTCGWILRLGVTIALLMSIHPALVLLALFALPTVLTSTWRPAVERARPGARRAGRPAGPPPVHDRDHRAARQGGARHRHRRPAGRRAARARGSAGTRPVAAARWGSAVWHTLAWAVFGAALRRRGRVRRRRASARRPATCCWCSPPASRLSAYIGATVGEIGFLRGIWMDGSRRLAWLEDYAASLAAHGRPAGARAARHAASASSTSRSPIPGTDRARARRRVARRCPPARSSRSSARTAPARRRW